MTSPRRLRRPIAKPAASAAIAIVMLGMGVVLPVREQERREALVQRITADAAQVSTAIDAYRNDTGDWPAPAFDLSSGYRGGLADRDFVDSAHRETWRGPYLKTALGRPTTNGFWSMAATMPIDASRGSRWIRLHRGFGEIEDSVAAKIDMLVDDGNGAAGRVRVTPTWIWFEAGRVSG